MIARYTLPEMAAIWTDQRKYEIWLEIETLACEAQAELGHIPTEDVGQCYRAFPAELIFLVNLTVICERLFHNLHRIPVGAACFINGDNGFGGVSIKAKAFPFIQLNIVFESKVGSSANHEARVGSVVPKLRRFL